MRSNVTDNRQLEKPDVIVFLGSVSRPENAFSDAAQLILALGKLEGRPKLHVTVADIAGGAAKAVTVNFEQTCSLHAVCERIAQSFGALAENGMVLEMDLSQIGRLQIRIGACGSEEFAQRVEVGHAAIFCAMREYPTEILTWLAWHFRQSRAHWPTNPVVTLGDFRWYTDADFVPLLGLFRGEGQLVGSLSLGNWLRKSFCSFAKRIALQTEAKSFSYQELDEITGHYAAELHVRGVRTGSIVAVCTGRGPEFVIALVAILKAGGVFFPLDPETPPARLQWELERVSPLVIVVSRRCQRAFPAMLLIEPAQPTDRQSAVHGSLDFPEVAQNERACFFLTSGTTGEPKVAILTQNNLNTFVQAARRRLSITEEDMVLQVAPPGFDVVLEDIFPALIAGGCLAFSSAPPCSGDADLVAILTKLRVTSMEISTAFWNHWVEYLKVSHSVLPSTLRQVVIGGDHVSRHALDYWHDVVRLPLINAYGMTEASCTSSMFTQRPTDRLPPIYLRGLPLGAPLANATLVLLDETGDLVPPLGSGEVFIGGTGVGAGYLNDAGLTAQKFDAFRRKSGDNTIYYRTGDIAYWNPAFGLMFVGRQDSQTKIRGYRIDVHEVENALLEIPGLSEAAVLVRHDRSREKATLVAAVVALNVEVASVFHHLRQKLPPYMVPTKVHILQALPRMPNGKVDREAILALEAACNQAVKNPVRAAFVRILGHCDFSDDESFLRAGGDSLGLLALASELTKLTGQALPLHQIYTHQTVNDLSKLLACDNPAT